jgi:hypothetical protein
MAISPAIAVQVLPSGDSAKILVDPLQPAQLLLGFLEVRLDAAAKRRRP